MDSDEDEPVYVPTPFVLSGAPPNRRLDIPQTVTWEKCLCHCVEDEQGQLTEFAERSWQSFLKAAAIRRDATWSFLKANNIDLEGGSQPRGRYHRRCYGSFLSSSMRGLKYVVTDFLISTYEKKLCFVKADQVG